jgi:hypothetical protein
LAAAASYATSNESSPPFELLFKAPQPGHIALYPGKKIRVPPVTAATTIIFEKLKLEALL